VQDLGRHRVEEGLGEFRLFVFEQMTDVVELHLLPGRVVEVSDVEFAAQAFDRLLDALVVEFHPLAHRLEQPDRLAPSPASR